MLAAIGAAQREVGMRAVAQEADLVLVHAEPARAIERGGGERAHGDFFGVGRGSAPRGRAATMTSASSRKIAAAAARTRSVAGSAEGAASARTSARRRSRGSRMRIARAWAERSFAR